MPEIELWLNDNYYKTIIIKNLYCYQEFTWAPDVSTTTYNSPSCSIVQFNFCDIYNNDGIPLLTCHNPNFRIGNKLIYEFLEKDKKEENVIFSKKVKAKDGKIGIDSRFDILDL